jgi:hypothetical protein
MNDRQSSPPRSAKIKRSNEHLDFVFAAALGFSIVVMLLVAFAASVWKTYVPADDLVRLPTLFGVYGDFLSGFLGPLLSLASIYFVVVTLREQREGDEVKAFENRYYQLLNIHRDNAREMEFGASSGRRAFVRIMEEVNLAMAGLDELIGDGRVTLSFMQQLQVAYYCVFFGVGPASSASLRPALEAAGTVFTDAQFQTLESSFLVFTDQIKSRPFQGHQSSLGHYYRHLYQTISFVDKEGPEGEKREYVKSIRAQLSNYEQALLLLNSLTGIGWEWWNDGYIESYSLVKNLPRGFVEIYCRLDVETLFQDGYFEWQQASGAPKIVEKVRETHNEALIEVAATNSQRLAAEENKSPNGNG